MQTQPTHKPGYMNTTCILYHLDVQYECHSMKEFVSGVVERILHPSYAQMSISKHGFDRGQIEQIILNSKNRISVVDMISNLKHYTGYNKNDKIDYEQAFETFLEYILLSAAESMNRKQL